MDLLFNIIAELSFELSPDRMNLLAEKFSRLKSVVEINSVRSAWGPNINRSLFERFMHDLAKHSGMTGNELAIAFKSAIAVAKFSDAKGRQELIWTGPATSSVAVRHTEQALCEVIQSATRRLFIVSFVAYRADGIISALIDALLRNVKINFLLESSKENGGAVDIDSVAILREKLPTARFYAWASKQNIEAASVHAKCAIADESTALITSANLTGKAMEHNMELGVLIRDGALPKQLASHLYGLISERIISPL
jgi:cardiolipin synthase